LTTPPNPYEKCQVSYERILKLHVLGIRIEGL